MFPKLFVTDLDGTALGGGYEPYARFPDHFSEFLDYLHDNGCEWAINTTWDAGGQWDLVNLSSVKSRPLFFMAEFGLRLARYTENGPEMVQPYVDKMEATLKEIQHSAMYPIINDISSKFKPEVMHFYGHLYSFHVIPEEAEQFNKYMLETYSNEKELNISVRDGRVGIYPKFMNKGEALGEAIKMLSINPEEVMIAGDETADLAMIKPHLAKLAVCPDNAPEKVKQYVLNMGGKVGKEKYGSGIIDAFHQY